MDDMIYFLEKCYKKAIKSADEKEKHTHIFRYLVELDHTKKQIQSYIKRNKLTNESFESLKSSIDKMNSELGLVTHNLPSNYF